ncbi:DEAD/DEAH box helicase [Acinetobacter soli]|uniref:DEAD/DEAH box helicase n=1 Tax=Acinetobacter soli TaxID=487316 RepID=UPI0012504809|nr:DEAD/DEAH box helicase [Acinetobacter soli]
MSNLPKKQEYFLNTIEKISDKVNLVHGVNIVRANTGLGKSTYALQDLTKDNKIILCCPTIAQVKQCEIDYGHREDIHFIHGEKGIPAKNLKKLCKHNIVITYDQFSRIAPYTNAKTILVIDECQKLYSAGNFRDKAIYPILSSIKKNLYDKVVLLTATLTEPLFEQLDLHVSQYFHLQKNQNLTRNLTIQSYPEENKFNGLMAICDRLKAIKKDGGKKIVFIRLNDIAKSKQIKRYLEKQEYNVMLINREEMSQKKCAEMLSLAKLDAKYEVVLCTSIMDEAINLNNMDDEVDSVHIMGQHAHPEEITQFIGRMRQASPPIFIHLSRGISTGKINCQKVHQQHITDLKNSFSKFHKYLQHEVLDLLKKDKFLGFENLISSKLDRVKSCNSLTNDVFECKGFMLDGNDICINTPSMAGKAYAYDLTACYSNVDYLKHRLALLLPNARIIAKKSKDKLSTDLASELEACADELRKTQKQVIPEIMADMIEKVESNSDTLITFLKSHNTQGINLYDKAEKPVHYEVFIKMGKLSEQLGNMVDISDAVANDRINDVARLSYHYKLHPIVHSLMVNLSKKIPKANYGHHKYTYAELTELMNEWLKLSSANRSIIALLNEYPLPYIEISPMNELVFNAGGSIRFLKKYCHVQVLNSKKAHEQKKIIFKSLCAFGYVFTEVPASYVSKFITVDDIEYDAKSGRKRHKTKKMTGLDWDNECTSSD